MTKREFLGAMTRLSGAYRPNPPFGPSSIDTWYEMVKEFSAAEIGQVITDWIKQGHLYTGPGANLGARIAEAIKRKQETERVKGLSGKRRPQTLSQKARAKRAEIKARIDKGERPSTIFNELIEDVKDSLGTVTLTGVVIKRGKVQRPPDPEPEEGMPF